MFVRAMSAEERARLDKLRKRAVEKRRKHGADNWLMFDEDKNAHTGEHQRFWYNLETEEVAVEQMPNLYGEHLIALNKAEQANNLNRPFGDMAKVASIPIDMLFHGPLAQPLQEKDDKFVKKLLNDADFSNFRTRGGSL